MNKPITTNQIQINPENLWLILGGAPTNSSNTFKTEDALIAAKVPQSQTAVVTKNIKWESGKIFYPWEPGLDPDLYPYYCVYNNILYLCVGNSPNNRKDESGYYLTSVPPTNTGALPVMGSDGYSWLPLYLIDYTKESFITDSDFPIPDFSVQISGSNFNSIYTPLCSNGITQTGKCCLYYKQATTDKITGITYKAGDLMHTSASSYCYECYDLAKKLDVYYKFKNGETASCDSVYEITTLLDQLNSIAYTLPPNSTKQFQLNLLEDYQNYYSGIFKADIDLSGICLENRLINAENPYLTIVDPHSDGAAKVKLKTQKIADNTHEVVGIEVEATGKDYIYPSFSISGVNNNDIINAINLYPYPMDLFETPEVLLKTKAFLINTQITVNGIKQIAYNNKFTKVALATDMKKSSDKTFIEYAPQSSEIKNLQTKIIAGVLLKDESGEEYLPPEGNPVFNLESNPIECLSEIQDCYISTNTSKNNYDMFIGAIRTGELLPGKNYGEVQTINGTIPGFKIEINDISDDSILPVEIGDRITILGNPCQVLALTKPDLDKNTEYFSPQNINLDIEPLGNDITLNFSIKVTT